MDIPLLAGFLKSSSDHKVTALKEVSVVAVFSFAPIYISALILLLVAPNGSEPGVLSALEQVVSQGELILYSCSIMAPILHLVYHEPGGNRRMRERTFQGVVVTVLLLLSIVCYALKYVGIIGNLDLLVRISYGLFGLAVFLWYIATVFRYMMNGDLDPRREEFDFKSRVFERRGEG